MGIRGKITLIFLAVFLVTWVPVSFFLFDWVSQSLQRADQVELEAEAAKILNQVRLEPFLMPLPPLGYQLDLYWQREGPPAVDSLFTSPDFVRRSDTLAYATLQRPEAGGQLRLELARSNERLRAELERVTRYLVGGSALALLLAAGLIYVVAGAALRPVKQIISVAQQIEASRSFERVPVPTARDEYATLAHTINAMLGRLEGTLRTQTNFFASAAHELKTPLAVMKAELSLAMAEAKEPRLQELLSNQLAEVEKLHHTIQDFLLVSQLKTETLVVRTQSHAVAEALYGAVKRLRYLSSERQVKLRVVISEEEVPSVLFDFEKTEIVLANLIENAMVHGLPGADVLIELSEHPHAVAVSVSNQVSEPLPPVTELRQEFKKSKSLSAGLGMGLWICDRLSALQGQSLQLANPPGLFKATLFIPKQA
ncbi:MAG: HAMP domain-containing histidine kinase [Cyclobacteriaceae bacterium]|jgi:signal transduction histidine kinase|nr:HAMP domain-containing histidine kinase [Cyclobacteriaceae bacterium]